MIGNHATELLCNLYYWWIGYLFIYLFHSQKHITYKSDTFWLPCCHVVKRRGQELFIYLTTAMLIGGETWEAG